MPVTFVVVYPPPPLSLSLFLFLAAQKADRAPSPSEAVFIDVHSSSSSGQPMPLHVFIQKKSGGCSQADGRSVSFHLNKQQAKVTHPKHTHTRTPREFFGVFFSSRDYTVTGSISIFTGYFLDLFFFFFVLVLFCLFCFFLACRKWNYTCGESMKTKISCVQSISGLCLVQKCPHQNIQ